MALERIALLGSSSGRNAGDAALLAGIMDTIDSAVQDRLLYEIPTFRPEYLWANYQNRVRPISMLPWHATLGMMGVPTLLSLMRCELALVFDAILFDRWLYNPLKNYLSTLAIVLPQLKQRGTKLGCFNVGVGPVHTDRGKDLLRRLLEAMDFITVRDNQSFDLVTSLGVKNPRIMITADAALHTKPCSDQRTDQILSEVGLARGQEILAVNFSTYLNSWLGPGEQPMDREHFIREMSSALDVVFEEAKAPCLFVCTQHSDVPLTRAVMQAMKSNASKSLLSNVTLNHHEIRGVLGAVSLLFGMRLHATILAAAGTTPISALPHQPKVSHFFASLGLEKFVFDFKGFSSQAVTDHLIDSWHNRTLIKNTLKERIPAQKKRALIPAKLVATLRAGKEIDEEMERLRFGL